MRELGVTGACPRRGFAHPPPRSYICTEYQFDTLSEYAEPPPHCAVKSLPCRSNYHSWKVDVRDSTPLSLDADAIKSRGLTWRCAVMTMRRVEEGLSAKGTKGIRSAYIRIRANGRCRGGTERQALCRGLALRQCADLPLP